jgi:hypothetical protein
MSKYSLKHLMETDMDDDATFSLGKVKLYFPSLVKVAEPSTFGVLPPIGICDNVIVAPVNPPPKVASLTVPFKVKSISSFLQAKTMEINKAKSAIFLIVLIFV